jgi:hypothetical protein
MSLSAHVTTQKQLLLNNLMDFYKTSSNLQKMMDVINGDSKISLRIVDWFVTNYAKKYFTVYEVPRIVDGTPSPNETSRFKVFHEYKLKLKAYAKKNFDPFCRWERIQIPYDDKSCMETTIGQLNFFKWAIENKIIDFIKANYEEIENDMNNRNSTSKRKDIISNDSLNKSRKKRDNRICIE